MKKKARKKYKIEFTKVSVALWGGLFLLLIVWVFILGVFAGKGFLPEESPTPRPLKKKEKIQTEEKKEPELYFHKRLTSSKTSQKKVKKNNNIAVDISKICYSVQVAAFFKEKDAKHMVNRFRKKGYDVYYSKIKKDNKIYYRVRCGRFETKKKAYLLKERLFKKEKIKGLIVRCR